MNSIRIANSSELRRVIRIRFLSIFCFALAGIITILIPDLAEASICPQGTTSKSYKVVAGDSLAKIAKRHRIAVSSIISQNPALQISRLKVGQKLSLCTGKKSSAYGRSGQNSGKKSGKRAKKSKACNYRMPLYVHSVVPGEMISQIAGRYGVRRNDILKLNPSVKKNPNFIRVGQKIRVCPEITPRARKKLTHSVRKGETSRSIAKKYELSLRELVRYQQGKLQNPSRLRIGQKLTIWADGAIVRGFSRGNLNSGILKDGVLLRPNRNMTTKHPRLSWGTARTISLLQRVVAKYKKRRKGGPKVHIGDISLPRGGKFPPHLSHQRGRDVDIGYVLKGSAANDSKFRHANKKNLDASRTWTLIRTFLSTNEIRYIFVDYKIQKILYEYAKSRRVSEDTLDELFQYPRGRGRTHGIIRHSKGHDDHFHVRFRG